MSDPLIMQLVEVHRDRQQFRRDYDATLEQPHGPKRIRRQDKLVEVKTGLDRKLNELLDRLVQQND